MTLIIIVLVYYAALLPRRAAYCVALCLSVCLSVRPVIERHVAPPSELQCHTEGRISYGHLRRTNLLSIISHHAFIYCANFYPADGFLDGTVRSCE